MDCGRLIGKNIVRGACNGVGNNSEPRFLFAAIQNPLQGDGVVDVIRIDGNFQRFDTNVFRTGTQSIPAADVRVVMDYFRQ